MKGLEDAGLLLWRRAFPPPHEFNVPQEWETDFWYDPDLLTPEQVQQWRASLTPKNFLEEYDVDFLFSPSQNPLERAEKPDPGVSLFRGLRRFPDHFGGL